ncbi:restriction endonuclease [Schleiferilactobacillus harbinensis]|uniref:Restriction endonuclease n=1 Tax=Schleiferilactobacillus harbinensis TaxID=304207 RepID=A0ABU7T263_9LACO
MEKKNFPELPRKQQEAELFRMIIEVLRQEGGRALARDIIQVLLESDNGIPEAYITEQRPTKDGQHMYQPFLFPFNFAASNLVFAKLITRPARGELELTKEGRLVDVAAAGFAAMVQDRARPEWQKRHEENLARKAKSADADVLDDETETPTDDWRQELITALYGLTPGKFELFARSLVKAMGVNLDETIGVKLTGDGGLDGYGYLLADDFRTTRVAIQAKRWQGLVPSPEIDKFRGAMDKYSAEYGIFVTTSNFTRDAIKSARQGSRVITLINGDRLCDLTAKYQVHVKPVIAYELDEFFDDPE